MVHKRSPESIVRRHALRNSRRDRELAETICRSTSSELSDAVKQVYGYVDQHVIFLDPGDVLTDSRGRGSLQPKPPLPAVFPFRLLCLGNGRTITVPLLGR